LKKPQALIGLLAALGTAIGVFVAVVGLPYGRADFTAFAELYHDNVDTTGKFHIAVDTDQGTSGTQDSTTVFLSATTHDVDLTIANSTAGTIQVGGWGFELNNPDITRIWARYADGLTPPLPLPACSAPALNCNPDFNSVWNTGSWTCDPPSPEADAVLTIEPGQDSFIGCFTTAPNGQMFPANPAVHQTMASVLYAIQPGALPGVVPLTITNGNLYDEGFTELMSCNPVITLDGPCFDGELVLAQEPTATNTTAATATATNTPAPPTNTATNTATATNTSTPIPPPSDSGIIKVCEDGVPLPGGNGMACNLWICDDTDGAGPICDGEGEGELRVVEQAINVFSDYDNDDVPDSGEAFVCTNFVDGIPNNGNDTGCIPGGERGLGAYEFSVEYDNFVIQSVNPCDIVFGPGGAGATRGPVDEVNSSLPENADCNPDPGAVNNGTCAMSLILENIVHFGCVTEGETPAGPSGPGPIDLASLVLIPHPDLNNDVFPGNNNGVLIVIKDNGCELADTLGHPTLGDVNGGLTVICRDLAVTVRILEGDLNLDCIVDLTDAQLIAARYGAFFGGLLYNKWFDLEPQFHDLDIDIKDVQKVFGRQDSDCQDPVPAQPPLPPPVPFQD